MTLKRFRVDQLTHPLYTYRCSLEDVEYEPSDFTHGKIVKKSGTAGFDPLNINECLSEKIVKRPTCFDSFEQDPITRRPLNPLGRTGLGGRGLLRNWGPNQAGDALVTRRTLDGKIEFVAIKRKDNGMWAIPGGRLEPGESVHECVRREFEEEACAFEEKDMPPIRERLDELFAKAVLVYHGVVLDPRTTDHAWMETQCEHVHIEDSHLFQVKGGDDASEAKWIRADPSVEEFKKLFANHGEMILLAIDRLQ